MASGSNEINDSYQAARQRSSELQEKLRQNPASYRVLTGDRPTGSLHLGHLFGSLLNRVELQRLGVELFIVIADYQVLNDRENFADVAANVEEIMLDYLAVGLDPSKNSTFIFPHSYVAEIHQLMLLFLPLISLSELERNPTVKNEARAANVTMNAGLFTYPVHQAADILFCRGNVVPVGKDQLPHLEVCRLLAQRFNRKFFNNSNFFPEPQALLSDAPAILGLDGKNKMSKSRGNAVAISATADQTASLIRKATTDSERLISYQPEQRPEVANLLLLLSLCSDRSPDDWATAISTQGAKRLKELLTEAVNEYLRPIRLKRRQLAGERQYLQQLLSEGIAKAQAEAKSTLDTVRQAMGFDFLR